MKKFWLKDLSGSQAISFRSREEYEKITEKLHVLGFKWRDGRSYKDYNAFDLYENSHFLVPFKGWLISKSHSFASDYEILTINNLHDFDEPLKIEVGKFYKTRGGGKARIYAIECFSGSFPIHGAVLLDHNSQWVSFSWTKEGKNSNLGGVFSTDIIEEWTEQLEINYSYLPTFKFVAMNKDGAWFSYTRKPSISSDGGDLWEAVPNSGYEPLKKNTITGFSGNWEDSLYEIKKGKLIKVG